jgi:hypothetical protein
MFSSAERLAGNAGAPEENQYATNGNDGAGDCRRLPDPYTSVQAQKVTAAEAREIAKEAYIYGYTLMDNYRVEHAFETLARRKLLGFRLS